MISMSCAQHRPPQLSLKLKYVEKRRGREGVPLLYLLFWLLMIMMVFRADADFALADRKDGSGSNAGGGWFEE